MARALSGRIHVVGQLLAVDPLHVGSGRDDVDTDMAVAVDGQGRVYVPGTGLAGAIRHWCRRRFQLNIDDAAADLVNRVFGFQRRADAGNDAENQGHAAYLFIEDALVRDPDGHPLEIRDHVGIDRQWGAAAEGIKFDRAVLPKGASLDLKLRLDLSHDGGEAAEAKALLGHILQALANGEIRLGAAKTRGLGRVRLTECEQSITEESWDRQGIIGRLQGALPKRSIDELIGAGSTLHLKPWPRLRIQVFWHPVTAVMVKAGVDGLRVDTLPLLGGVDGQRTMVIPGNGFKGSLRTRAELILRTLLGRDRPIKWFKETKARKRFLNQLDEDLPLIQELFGARGRRRDNQGQGALSPADCFAHNPAPADSWNRLFFDPADGDEEREQRAFNAAKAATRRTGWQKSTHVAIDRWTGGSAEGLLYSVLEPLGESWPAFELQLDVDRIGRTYKVKDDSWEAESDAELRRTQAWVLLLITLRDLARQRVPIGFGGNRGLGEIEVERIAIEPIDGPVLGIEEKIELPHGDIAQIPEEYKKQWQVDWETLGSEPQVASED